MTDIIQYKTQGTCTKQITVEIDNYIVKNIEFVGGCHGNLQGIRSLCIGMNINDICAKLKGILCNTRPTSCPDQLALCLEQYIKEKEEQKTSV